MIACCIGDRPPRGWPFVLEGVMIDILPLSALGRRIMVLDRPIPENPPGRAISVEQASRGASGSAAAPANTNWEERSDAESRPCMMGRPPGLGHGWRLFQADAAAAGPGDRDDINDSLSVQVRRYVWRRCLRNTVPEGWMAVGTRAGICWHGSEDAEQGGGTRDLARRSVIPYVFCANASELNAIYAAGD